IPTFEWGPASSPIIWNGLVILQCDTQADSFLLALNAETGETVWKTDRHELPSWGTPTVAATPAGPELVTNAATYIRGYDPRTGARDRADHLERSRERPMRHAGRCVPPRAQRRNRRDGVEN